MPQQNSPLDRLPAAGLRPVRPRRSASLILIDRTSSAPRFLLGRRHAGLKFMPGKFVFPGGRTERGDHRITTAGSLSQADQHRLRMALGTHASAATLQAIAVAAIREAFEETGMMIGRQTPVSEKPRRSSAIIGTGLAPDLSALRLVARAITPPVYPHRYDTHFFAAFRDRSVGKGVSTHDESAELLAVAWFTYDEACELDLPIITRTILKDVNERLSSDPDLEADAPVPFYLSHRGHAVRRTC